MAWLQAHGIRAARFQQRAWRAYEEGLSGLIAAPTGSGKTLAAIGGPLIQAMAQLPVAQKNEQAVAVRGVRILWVTPLRALASDTKAQLLAPLQALLPHWHTVLRTGDATAKDRAAVQKGLAQLLVTTPESLAQLLSNASSSAQFHTLQAVVIDEWHELLSSKRGVLLQLNLARLRRLSPAAQVWGMSATIGNMQQALQVLVREKSAAQCAIIQDTRSKPFALRSLLPPEKVRLPWAGHLGLANIEEVLKIVLQHQTSLVFTNTRAQAELWFQALSSVWPLSSDSLALHHGSLDQAVRQHVEQGLQARSLRCVVATSSLDLGVDFPAVDLVVQIGAAHSVARTVQRAGRAKHQPGQPVHITAVATQALELCEFAATRELAQAQQFEGRPALFLCMDVLAQHVMSMSLADGFVAEELFNEVRSSAAFASLAPAAWQQVLDFLLHGGQALDAYPQYRRLVRDSQGRYVPADSKVARRHRLAMGTITSQSMVQVQFLRGARVGSVEEAFISKLSPGDVFNFAGRSLELFKVESMTAWVRLARKKGTVTPAWMGGRLPFSDLVGQRMQALLSAAHQQPDVTQPPEMVYLQPLIALQSQRSHVPTGQELLVETVVIGQARGGKAAKADSAGLAWCLYPFAGRGLHEALALLLAHRLAQRKANTFAWSCNHLGLMLVPAQTVAPKDLDWPALLSPENLEADIAAAVNFTELSRRRFREVAQIAGLLNARIPGMGFNTRQLQVSAGLLFDVLSKYEPHHLLLQAARHEVLAQELQVEALGKLLQALSSRHVVLCHPTKHTPFSFGLWAESLRGQLSNETWLQRVRRMAQKMDA
jgi:ATP-dependent helicase Lhr and Lhr-like helicase